MGARLSGVQLAEARARMESNGMCSHGGCGGRQGVGRLLQPRGARVHRPANGNSGARWGGVNMCRCCLAAAPVRQGAHGVCRAPPPAPLLRRAWGASRQQRCYHWLRETTCLRSRSSSCARASPSVAACPLLGLPRPSPAPEGPVRGGKSALGETDVAPLRPLLKVQPWNAGGTEKSAVASSLLESEGRGGGRGASGRGAWRVDQRVGEREAPRRRM